MYTNMLVLCYPWPFECLGKEVMSSPLVLLSQPSIFLLAPLSFISIFFFHALSLYHSPLSLFFEFRVRVEMRLETSRCTWTVRHLIRAESNFLPALSNSERWAITTYSKPWLSCLLFISGWLGSESHTQHTQCWWGANVLSEKHLLDFLMHLLAFDIV